jgi:hypothetical protein
LNRVKPSDHPVALANAIEVLTTRWPQVTDVDLELLAPPGSLRASSGEVRQALDRRLRAIQGEEVEL